MKKRKKIRVVGIDRWDFATLEGALSFVADDARRGICYHRNSYLCISGLQKECVHIDLYKAIPRLIKCYPYRTEIAHQAGSAFFTPGDGWGVKPGTSPEKGRKK